MATPPSEARREAKRNGHAVNGPALPEGWNLWPRIGEATRQLGCATNVIYTWVRRGELRNIIAPDGSTRYNPDDLKELGVTLENDFAAQKTGGLSAEEFKAGNELVRFVMQSFERMVPILVSGFESASARAIEQSERDHATIAKREERIASLEKERDEQAKVREEQISEAHVRHLAEASFAATERRKDKAFGVLTNTLAPVLIKKFGLDSDPKVKNGLALLTSIKRDQMLALLALGDMLEENQKKMILELLGDLSDEERKALEEVGAIEKSSPPEKPAVEKQE